MHAKWPDVRTAVDTDILVRLLTAGDPKQAAAARSFLASGPVWIAKTVLLETVWVLRNLYGFDEPAIRDAFLKLLGLENVHAEDDASVAAALALAAHGIDLADALNLAAVRPARASSLSTSLSSAAPIARERRTSLPPFDSGTNHQSGLLNSEAPAPAGILEVEGSIMCLAVPGRIVRIETIGENRLGDIDFAGITRQAYLDFVPEASLGDYVMVHVGFAISKVDADEAQRTYQLLQELGEAEAESRGQ